jgi:hypothetical protein
MGIELRMGIAVQKPGLQSPDLSRVQDKIRIPDSLGKKINYHEKSREYDEKENPLKDCPGSQVGFQLIQFYSEIAGNLSISHRSLSGGCRIKVVVQVGRERSVREGRGR